MIPHWLISVLLPPGDLGRIWSKDWRISVSGSDLARVSNGWRGSQSKQKGRGINACWTNERGPLVGSAKPVKGRGKAETGAEGWGVEERDRSGVGGGGGRYCYLRFIVITDGSTSLASNPERSYNHPTPFHRRPRPSTPTLTSRGSRPPAHLQPSAV